MISPLHALVEPRFTNLLIRAANRERVSREQVSPTNLVHSPSTVTTNFNAWSPETPTTKVKATEPEQ